MLRNDLLREVYSFACRQESFLRAPLPSLSRSRSCSPSRPDYHALLSRIDEDSNGVKMYSLDIRAESRRQAIWKGAIMGIGPCILTKVCCAPFMGEAVRLCAAQGNEACQHCYLCKCAGSMGHWLGDGRLQPCRAMVSVWRHRFL